MAIVKNLIPKRQYKKVKTDDFFDPLFNINARESIKDTYGINNIFTPVYGYADLLDNTFAPKEGQWGPLGPAMGILGTFGRTLDKAEDFVLGGMTEGVNAVNQINPLSSTPDVQVQNPFTNIFVNDEDYTGNKLLAAMANNMGRLAGNTAVTESDFNDTTWKPTSLAIEIGTDPGVFGGFLNKTAVNSTAKNVGQLLSNYDDIVTKGAWDVSAPGLRTLVKNHLGNIRQFLGVNTAKRYKDMDLKDLNAARNAMPPEQHVESVVDEMLYDANERWQSALKSAENLSNTFEDIPSVTTQLRNQLDEIENMLFTYGKGDDNLIINIQNLRDKLDDIDKFIADPKQFNDEVFDTAPIVEQVNEALKDKELDKLLESSSDLSSVKAQNDILDALGAEDVGIMNKNTGMVSSKHAPKYSAANIDYRGIADEVTTFIDKEMSDNPGHPVTINPEFADEEYPLTGIYNAIRDGEYYTDEWVSNVAKRKLDSFDTRSLKSHQSAHFVTSILKNTNSETGDNVVKFLREEFKNHDISNKIINNDASLSIIPKEDLDYLKNNYNKLFGNVKKKVSNKDAIDASEAILNKLTVLSKNPKYRGVIPYSDTHLISGRLQRYIDIAKYGYGDWNIKAVVKSYNDSLAFYDDLWNLDNYKKVKENLIKNNASVDLMLDKSIQVPAKDVVFNNPKYKHTVNGVEEMYSIDTGALIDAMRAKMKLGVPALANTDYTLTFKSGRPNKWAMSLRKSNLSLASNPYALKGFDQLNPLEQDYLSYLNSKYNLYNVMFLSKDKRNAILDNIKNVGFDFNLDYKTIDSFLLDLPKKEVSKEASEVIQGASKVDVTTLASEADEAIKIGKARALDAAKKSLEELPDDVFTKYVVNSSDLNQDMFKAKIEKTIEEAGVPEEERRTLFKLLSEEMQVPTKTSKGEFHTLKTQRVKEVLNKASSILDRYGVTPGAVSGDFNKDAYKSLVKDTEMYYAWKDALNGDVTPANSFLDELFSSGGISVGVYNKIANKKKFDEVHRAILHNVTEINKHTSSGQPFVQFISNDLGDGKVILGYHLNYKNMDGVKDFAKFKLDANRLVDINWADVDNAYATSIKSAFDSMPRKFTFDELDEIHKSAQEVSEDFSTKIGYTNFKSDYFMHAMNYNDSAERYLSSKVYTGLNTEDISAMADAIQQYRNVSGGHLYGIRPMSRRLRGSINDWNNLAKDINIFTVNPYEVTKRTFTDGIFNNANFQNHVGMFFNPNFRISSYAENIDDLKRILFAKEGQEYTGNLDNLILAAPKYNEAGRVIGFTQFNKFDDKALQKALNNPETVLLPTHSLAPLDKLLRKDMKMSNKVYAFINKYLTVPIKFGTLTNLGFLTGNIGDAYLKQSVTMAEKYNTSVAYELARTAESVRNVRILNNRFQDTFSKYVDDMRKKMGDSFIDYYAITDSLISTPKARLNFEEWLKLSRTSGKITENNADVANLWLYLNTHETTSVFKGDFQNLGDVAALQQGSKYSPPLNPAEKLTKKVVDNKISRGIMNASGTVETYARSAEILNDLTREYGSKNIYKILGDPDKYAKEFDTLNVKLSEALNAMSASNFDYEYINNILDGFGTMVPFPTFVAKNFGYWLDIMVNKPEVMDTIINMQEVAWRGKDISTDKFQAEAKGRGAIPLSASKDSKFLKGIFKPTPYQSMFGAFDVMQDPVSNLAFRVNPIATPITHHLQDVENDKYRPYSLDPYEKNINRENPNYNVLRATFHRINPYERTMQNWMRLPSKAFVQNNAQISDVLPSVFQPDFSKTSKRK